MKTCNRCGIEKAFGEFFAAKWSRDGYMHQCKACRRALVRAWEQRNPEKMTSIRKLNDAKYRDKRRAYEKGHYQRNIHHRRTLSKANHHARKDAVFQAYGGYRCACCGEAERAFLCIDHINNDGAAHRKQIGTRSIYRWLAARNFPPGFQVLCFNCNQGKRIHGVCPHQARRLIAA